MGLTLSERQRRWLGFVSVVSCISLIFTDQSILPVAIPTILRELHESSFSGQWMINSYFLAMSIFILAAGKISDIIGHRKIFLLGLSIFLFASLFCAVAINGIWLICFRLIQGIGAALMVPSSFTILLDLFPADKRGLAVGINAAVGSFFLALAPYVGGLFTQYLSWRWVFWINIPICFIGQLFGILAIGKPEVVKEKFDFQGFSMFTIFMFCFILAFMQAKIWGWISPGIIILFIFAIIFFIFFVILLKKSKSPYLDFTLFRCKTFISSAVLTFLGQVANASTIFWAIYFQDLLGFSPSKAGFTILLVAIPIMVMAPIGGKLLDKYSAKVPICAGLFLLLFSFVWFSTFFKTGNIILLLPALLATGWGYTFVLSPALAVGITSVANTKRGMATGVLGTLRNSGLTIGIALVGALLLNVGHSLYIKKINASNLSAIIDPDAYEGLLSKVPKAIEAFNQLSTADQTIVRKAMMDANLYAFISINIFSGIIILIASIFVIIRIIRKRLKG